MNIKRCTALLAAATILASGFSAYAEFDPEKNVYNFKYTSESGNALKLNVLCLPESENPATLSNVELAAKTVFADDFEVEANGTVESSFGILDTKAEGKYNIWIYTDRYVAPTAPYDTFYFPSTTGLATMLSDFNADSPDYDLLFGKYTSANYFMLKKVDITDAYYIANKTDIHGLLSKHKPFKTSADIDNAFVDAVIVSKLNKATADDIEAVVDSLMQFTETAETQSYKNNKELVLGEFLNKKAAFEKCSDAVASLKNITVLALVNNTDENSKMADIIKDYATYIGVDYTKYTNAGTSTVNRYLINKNFTTVTAIKEAVNNGITAAANAVGSNNNNNNTSNNKNNSSGGGGFYITNNSLIGNNTNNNTSSTTSFADVKGVEWAETAINTLAQAGVIEGDENGMFRPNDSVKREEFLKMLMKAFNLSGSTTAVSFGDVDANAWYAPYVSAAYTLNITNGKSDSVFGIGDNIKREEMATFITRTLSAVGKKPVENGEYVEFADNSDISDYARESIISLQKAGIIQGMDNNRFNPADNCTRAQAAVIIYRALDNAQEGAVQ